MNDDKDFAYFLTVDNIHPKESELLLEMMQQDRFFYGELSPSYDTEDIKQNRIAFDCDAQGGSIREINKDDIDQTMHALATTFPNAKFHLFADDVEDHSAQYQICTYGDMYQYAEQASYMPELSDPVPFDKRQFIDLRSNTRTIYMEEFLHNTDFNLLYEQKKALLAALEFPSSLSEKTVEGLVNFLDFIQDWAEREGVFVSPAHVREDHLNAIMQLIHKQLGESGEISYPLPDGKSYIQISVEYGSDECMNPGKEFYELKVFHPKNNGFESKFSAVADFRDASELREACEYCLDEFEVYQQRQQKQPLSNLISSASNRAASPTAPSKQQDLEK